ncbi:AfsA-related hotdog domain-containing protein [Kitasatospora sp. NBC_01287]|uniref:AfsA-related hotdog domain-containing protein n=1 Tax=Kitasatospora sp. NBC_01287 TaxID=2903573 RepID=UPI00224E6A57|nr:AfsA-related hotdog domain-containing protein [Kitasatospora sp. NBC_01287]MCX4746050.1 AfsA-related hotdog domain-containing protein [Kitasatospora sp. NBC_01287]
MSAPVAPGKPLLVVGDRFEEFLALPGTIAASVLLERLRTEPPGEPLRVTVGQGLTGEQLVELDRLAESAYGALTISQGQVPLPVERSVTHKVFEKNVLIGEVEELGEGRYRVPLVLDQHVEVLEDHLTGLHIPAVTLLEAARQTWTAVTEQYLIEAEPRTRFVISGFRSVFENFVFPLPADLEYQLLERKPGPVGESISFNVEVWQLGRVAARFEAEIRVIPELFAVKQETMAARQALRDTTDRYRQQPVLAFAEGA